MPRRPAHLLIWLCLLAGTPAAASSPDAPMPPAPADPASPPPAEPAGAPSPALETYLSDARGEIEIGADGGVVRAVFQSTGMDERMRAAYVAQMAKWTFEPVVEGGKPVAVRVPFKLSLRAVVDPATELATLHIDRAWFLSTAATPGAPAGGVQADLDPPRFPLAAWQAGAGARITLMLELREKGRVARVAARDVLLLSVAPGPDTDRHVAAMVEAAEKAAADWRIPGYDAGAKVLVPVVFKADKTPWSRTYPYAYTPVAWVRESSAADSSAAESLANGVGPLDDRIRLLTPLGDDRPPAGDG